MSRNFNIKGCAKELPQVPECREFNVVTEDKERKRERIRRRRKYERILQIRGEIQFRQTRTLDKKCRLEMMPVPSHDHAPRGILRVEGGGGEAKFYI